MNLRIQLIVLIMLAAVPVLFVQIYYDLQIRDSRRTDLLRSAETLANLIAARQDRIVEGARLLLEATSHLQSVREKNGEACNVRLQSIAQKVEELTAMAVMSLDGERWCVSIAGSGPINLSDRDYFQRTLQSGTMQTSDYIVGRQTGEGSFVFTYPARDAGGSIFAIVFLAYRTSVLSRLLNEPALPAEATVTLIDRHKVVTAHWPEPQRWVGKSLAGAALVDRAAKERIGSTLGKADWVGPGEFAVAYAPVRSPTSLTAIVTLPQAAALRAADRLFWQQVALTSLIFLMAGALAYWAARYLVILPLADLESSLEEFSKGEFAFAAPVRGMESAEVRSLSKHAHSMARALQTKTTELTEALHHKEMLLKEVNHRVKNSLQLVASLLALQGSNIRDKEARQQFEEASRRINTVAQIHQRLYQDENVDDVSVDQFLRDMCEQLSRVTAGNQIAIRYEGQSCHLPTQQIVPLALIVNELVTNALKYAYNGDEAGTIIVNCEPTSEAIGICVSDHGAALPASFDPAAGGGLGMKMVRALTKQLRGEFKVVSRPIGKSFVVRVPRPRRLQ